VRRRRCRRAQAHRDVVATTDSAHDEQTHATRCIRAHLAAGGEALVGIEDIGRRHADTEICDLDDHGAVDGAGSVDGDGGLRRGVPQRIVEQFSDEVNDVRGSMTGDDSGRYLPEFDASIFLDA